MIAARAGWLVILLMVAPQSPDLRDGIEAAAVEIVRQDTQSTELRAGDPAPFDGVLIGRMRYAEMEREVERLSLQLDFEKRRADDCHARDRLARISAVALLGVGACIGAFVTHSATRTGCSQIVRPDNR